MKKNKLKLKNCQCCFKEEKLYQYNICKKCLFDYFSTFNFVELINKTRNKLSGVLN